MTPTRVTRGRRAVAPAAFTLLEVMMAITIFGIVAVTLYGTFSRTLRSKAVAEERAEVVRTGRGALARMADEIGAAFYPERGGDGFVFRSLDGGTTLEPLDAILFSALSARPSGSFSRDSDQRVIAYFFPQSDGHMAPAARGEAVETGALEEDDAVDFFAAFGGRGVRVPGIEPKRLLRREAVVIRRDALDGSAALVFLDNVASLDFRFFDGADWVDTWDSEDRSTSPRRLPRAIAIDLALYDRNGDVHHFATAVDLALADARPRPGGTAGTGSSPRPTPSPRPTS